MIKGDKVRYMGCSELLQNGKEYVVNSAWTDSYNNDFCTLVDAVDGQRPLRFLQREFDCVCGEDLALF